MDNVNGQVGQVFDWKQIGQSFVNAIPYALLSLQQYRQQNRVQGINAQAQPQFNPAEVIGRGKEYLAKTKTWLGQFPIIKIGGGLLILDGIVSIFTHLDEKKINHIIRLARAGLGYYIIRKL